MKLVIVINGIGGSGKDTFIDIIKNNFKIPVFNISSIDEVKEELKNPSEETIKLLDLKSNWDGITKDDYWREKMVKLKKLHEKDNDRPNRTIIKKVREIDNGLIFIHVREPKNIQILKENIPNLITLLINRKSIITPNNSSDRGVFDYEYDLIFNNDSESLDTFRDEILEFIKNSKELSWIE